MSRQAAVEQQVWYQVSSQVGRQIYDRVFIVAQVSGAVLDGIVWYQVEQGGNPLWQAWDRVRKQAKEDSNGSTSSS